MICMLVLVMGYAAVAVEGMMEPVASEEEHVNPEVLYVLPSAVFTATPVEAEEVHWYVQGPVVPSSHTPVSCVAITSHTTLMRMGAAEAVVRGVQVVAEGDPTPYVWGHRGPGDVHVAANTRLSSSWYTWGTVTGGVDTSVA
jgi:hypothetical protein